MPNKNRKHLLSRNKPDSRDIRYEDVWHLPVKLPVKIDLRNILPPIWDQDGVGVCHAEGVAKAVCAVEKQEGIPVLDPSVLFLAWNARALEGTQNHDSGASIRDTIKAAAANGICSAETWPFVPARLCVRPPPAAYTEARGHVALQYQSIQQTSADYRGALANGHVFPIGIEVFPSFESAQVARTGLVPLPRLTEQSIGGHCILICGYDDIAARFTFANSWGTSWALGGYGTIPYAYLLNPNIAWDAFAIQRAT
jgi:hypothetical protein